MELQIEATSATHSTAHLDKKHPKLPSNRIAQPKPGCRQTWAASLIKSAEKEEDETGEAGIAWELVRTVRSAATKYHCIESPSTPSRFSRSLSLPLSLRRPRLEAGGKPAGHHYLTGRAEHDELAFCTLPPLTSVIIVCFPETARFLFYFF